MRRRRAGSGPDVEPPDPTGAPYAGVPVPARHDVDRDPAEQADLVAPGPRARVRANIDALRVLTWLIRRQRPPTPFELAVLVRWTVAVH